MQVSIAVPFTVVDAQILLDTIEFRPMDETDFMTFAGADEADMIGDFGDFGICIIGACTISFYDFDDEFVNETNFRHVNRQIFAVL